jgi:hypothetical protein
MAITVKHSKVSTIPDDADTSLVRPSDWNADHTLTGTIPIVNGGTGQATANDGFNALAPSQTGNTGKYLTTDGTNSSWSANPLGTVTSVGTGTGLTGGPITTSGTISIDSTVVTLTGTQTLTNKTLTSPKVNEILDANGNEVLGLLSTASATDYVGIKNGIGVGVPLHISSEGSSTNIGLHIQPKGSGLVTISDGTDFNKGIRFRSSGSAASAITLLDAVATAGRVVTLPDATTTLVGRDTTDTLTNKSISGSTNTLSNIGNASLTNSAITINGTSTSLGGSISVGTVTSVSGTAGNISSTGGATPVLDLVSTAVTPATYTLATITVDDKGRITSASNGSGGAGSVTSVSVVSANGLAGTVANATTTPAITLSTSITGVLKGNGTAISAATAGTDYSAGTSALGTGILKSTTTTGALTIAVAADFPTLNQNTTGTASNVTGTVAIANGGTGETTRQNAMDALAGAVTSGSYLRGNGTDVVMSTIQVADVPTLNQNTTGSSGSCTGNAATATTANKVANSLTAGTGISFSAGTTYDGSAAITISSSITNPIPTGTVMLFYQSAAPTGWTQVTTLNDYDLRLVSGAGGTTGGTTAYSTVFTNQTPSYTPSNGTLAAGNGTLATTAGTLAVGAGTLAVSATTLSTSQIPSHTHPIPQGDVNFNSGGGNTVWGATFSANTGATGGGGSHTHSLTGSPSISGAPALTGSVALTGTVGGSVGAVTLNVRYANIIICSKN